MRMPSPNGLNFCTIISKNYLASARVLAKSIRQHHPDAAIYVLLVDRLEGYFDPQKEPFELFLIDELPIPQLPRFCFQYQVLELNTAVKPYFLKFLLDRFQMKKLVYLDPDIQVYQPMVELNFLLDEVGIALTPHVLTPCDNEGCLNEIDILRAGVYNLGFIGLSDKQASFQLLDWWQKKLYKGCLKLPEQHYMVDQRWVDLVPGYFEDLSIFRAATYNVAYWNLHERRLSYFEETLLVNGVPCVFMHFSGYNPLLPSSISKYQSRFKMNDLMEGGLAYKRYARELIDEGYEESINWPYAFNSFDNGHSISQATRELYRALDDKVVEFGDPFVTKQKKSFFLHCKQKEAKIEEKPEHGINLIGMFHSEKGTGQAARCVYRSVKKSQIPCSLLNCDSSNAKNIEDLGVAFSNTAPFKINLINFNADMPLQCILENADQLLVDRYNIGYWNWELETFPKSWLESFANYDEIWVPSTFTQKSIEAIAPIPVICIPYSIEIPEIPPSLNRERFGLSSSCMVFLFVFDCDSFTARKNPHAVIKAFKLAFEEQTDVQLVIKMMGGANNKKAIEELTDLAQGQRNIIFIDSVFTREESYGLMKTCDVFVSLHRSEGFGFNICEAMAMGKPVIATNYSAITDYLNDFNGYLVEYQKVTIDQDYGPYKKGEVWAEPNINHASFMMRHVYANREEAKRKGLIAQMTMNAHCSEEVVGKKIKKRLDVVYNKKREAKIVNQDFQHLKQQINVIDYPIMSTRPLIGRALILMRKIGKWAIKPALEKQSKVNNSHFVQLTSLMGKIESLENEIQHLKKIVNLE